jgi:hypothetical protein
VSEDKIQPNAIIGEQEDFTTLNASNRYFTPKKDAQMAKELRFDEDVDPHGNLTRHLGTGHVHIEENSVSYYERVGSVNAGETRYIIYILFCQANTRKCRYVAVKPACVSVGDIVELQVSFIMVPLRDNRFKATMVLRSILVLDRTYTQVKSFLLTIRYYLTTFAICKKAAAKRFAQLRTHKSKPVENLKRRVGYFEEQLSTTRAKLADMQVDEEDVGTICGTGI